jgi:signal transduction histidine kinase
MSLRLKYIVPLNLVILTVWAGHAAWNLSVFEKAFMRSEVEALEHLALGLKYHIEHSLRQGEDIGHEQRFLRELTSHRHDLDIMVLDEQSVVILGTDPTRIGARWIEESIKKAISGRSEFLWNLHGHTHKGRRAIDVSLGARDESGRVRFVIHIAKWLDNLHAALWQQRLNHVFSAGLLLIAVAVGVNLLTYKLVLRHLWRINRKIDESAWPTIHAQQNNTNEVVRLGNAVSAMLDQIQRHTDDLRDTINTKQDKLNEVSVLRDSLADRVVQVSDELAKARERLIRAERLVALGHLSAALAHELRNPLHIVRATAETAERHCPDVAKHAQNIIEEVDRIEQLVKELLDYTRTIEIHRKEVDIRAMLESVRSRTCRGLCNSVPEDCRACVVSIDGDALETHADPVLLEQAVINLLTNAREVSPKGSLIELGAKSDDADGVVITVADRGPGIADEDLPRVFEPFFARKPKGTGFGLPVVERIADMHGGSITLEHREGGGMIARLHISAKEKGDAA